MTFINVNVLSNFVSLQCLSSLLNAYLQNTMAEQNVPAQPPTRTDEQFVPKGESVEVFGMAIPDPLITEAIRQSSYYPTYVKMVAENTKKTPQG
ncbi:hypothetical protein Tco_0123966, partial [Tanacetum coccineum]